MKTLWFITNPDSGSTTRAKCDALEAVFEEAGLALAGRSEFPEQRVPTPEELDGHGVDTVVLFAGDGTINTALCALADWKGAFLILPGGTMNLLAKALHEETDPHAIVHAAHGETRHIALPYAEAGKHRAFVGLILGPVAKWARAREAARKGRLGAIPRAIRDAWQRTFGEHVRIAGAPGLRGSYQAVLVRPEPERLVAAGVDARDWRSIVELGWEWLTGDWVAARAVTEVAAQRLRTLGTKPSLALFDGEPVTLEPMTEVTHGLTRPAFIATRKDQ